MPVMLARIILRSRAFERAPAGFCHRSHAHYYNIKAYAAISRGAAVERRRWRGQVRDTLHAQPCAKETPENANGGPSVWTNNTPPPRAYDYLAIGMEDRGWAEGRLLPIIHSHCPS